MNTTNRQAPASMAGATGNYAVVNGLNMYYEIHNEGKGTGVPLVLLHGGLGAIDMFVPILPLLAEGRQVIGVDLQAHGRTADIDRPMRLDLMGGDVAALIEHLGLEKVDLMGYSMGGAVALQTIFQRPDLVRKLVVVSVPFARDGWYPEIRDGMAQVNAQAAEAMKQTPMYETYARLAPKPEDWPVLLTKISGMLKEDYDWSQEVAAIQTPTMIVVGDADSVRTAHAVEFFELLGGGKGDGGWDGSGMSNARLAILPGTTHYTIFSSPSLASTVIAFLDAPMPETT